MSKRKAAPSAKAAVNAAASDSVPAKVRAARPTPAVEAPSSRWEQLMLALLVAVPVLLIAIQLLPELTTPVPASNDLSLHWQMVQAASDALSQGRNPLDFWMPQIELGYPQFLYYQNLPHLIVALTHKLLFGLVPLRTLFDLSRYLLLVGLPLTMYWTMRRLEFSMRAAAIGAAVVSLVAARDGFGLEYDGHLWIGRGLYTQLWAEHLALVVMATLYRVFRTGRGYLPAILAITALALTHFIWSYIAAIASVMLLVLVSDRGARVANLVRLSIVGVTAAVGASYMLIPFVQSGSRYVAVAGGTKSANFNALTPLASALTGVLMDEGRWPILTLLVLLGIVAALRRPSRSAWLALIGTGVWLVLYEVRPTDVTWFGRTLRYDGNLIFRFVGMLEMFAVMLIGVGGAWLWELIASRVPAPMPSTDEPTDLRFELGPTLALAALLLILSPALEDRFDLLSLDHRSIVRTDQAIAADPDLTRVIDSVVAQPTGRAYLGTERNWGKALRVGPLLRAYDVLKARGHVALTSPYQALSLNTDITVAFNDGNPALYDLLDVRYIIVPSTATPPPFVTTLITTPRYTLYRAPTSGVAMYVGVVERRAITSQVDLVEQYDTWARTNGPEQRRFIRWDYFTPAGTPSPTAPCPDGGKTLSESMSGGDIDVVVACPAASTLVFKSTYHPNWHVTVDGKPAESYMVSPAFLAVDLPAGQHAVSARYVMASNKLVLLAIGLAALLGAALLRDKLDWFAQRVLPSTRTN